MADSLEAQGHRVLRVWLTAPEEETLARLKQRIIPRAPTSAEKAHEIYLDAAAIAGQRKWDVIFDTSGEPKPERLVAAFAALLG
jgi:hypothetical protein